MISKKPYFILITAIMASVLVAGQAQARPSYGDCRNCHGVPTVTAFELPASHDSLTVPIVSFAGYDTDQQVDSMSGVTGYLLTTTASAPTSSQSGWQNSAPSSFTFTSSGAQTLYAWVKDTVGNVSASIAGVVNIVINGAPIADAGPDQTVNERVMVSMNASNSIDPDDGIAHFQWSQIAGPAVSLSDATAENPSFVAPDVGPAGASLTFRVLVTDFSGAQDSDSCIVNISWVNETPVADAGQDLSLAEGETAQLDGSSSHDSDDGIAKFFWEQTGGPTVELTDPAAVRPEFILSQIDGDGVSLSFQLTVTDTGGLQDSDTCLVNISSVNLPPLAHAGDDQTAMAGDVVALEGSASTDPDGDAISYLWKQTAGTPVVLSDTSAIQPIFTAPEPANDTEVLVFELTITDSAGLQNSDACTVLIQSPGAPPMDLVPTADAGIDQSVAQGTTVILDGSASKDAEGPVLAYLWTQMAGVEVALSDPTSASPIFTAPETGAEPAVLTFELTVVDAQGQEATDSCIVTVQAVEPPPIEPPQNDTESDDDSSDDYKQGDQRSNRWKRIKKWPSHVWGRYFNRTQTTGDNPDAIDEIEDDGERYQSRVTGSVRRNIRYFKINIEEYED